jgi:hypothetical protein
LLREIFLTPLPIIKNTELCNAFEVKSAFSELDGNCHAQVILEDDQNQRL